MRENSVNARKQEFGLGGGLGQGAGRGTVTMRDLPSAMWRALASPNANLRGAHTILFCVHTQKLYSTSHRAYTASNARTRETYLLLQVPQSVLVCAE